MSKKKNKFDLSHLVHDGAIKEGDTLYFVSDATHSCVVKKTPSHEFKVEYKGELHTIHNISQKFLGTEPPDHASRWLRTAKGHTLYELWQSSLEEAA